MSTATNSHTPAPPRFAWARTKALQSSSSNASSSSSSSSSSGGSSSSAMPATTSSSGKSTDDSSTRAKPAVAAESHATHVTPATPAEAPPLASWTSGTFSFPPCSSRTIRSLPIPPLKHKPQPVTTTRVINSLPGFDDLAELVMASESTTIPLTTAPTPPTPTSTKRRRAKHTRKTEPSVPKPITPTLPAPITSLPWSNEDDAGRVTFIFGRLGSVKKGLAPPPPDFGGTGSSYTTIFRRGRPLGGGTEPLSVPDVSPHLAHLRA